ncbi:hypothetical protein LINPERHAP1_LOCUS30356 [Linum perenne]
MEDANSMFLKGVKGSFTATDEPYDSITQEDCKVMYHYNEMEAAIRMPNYVNIDLQVADYRNYKLEDEEDYGNMYWRRTEFVDGEYGELSLFSAGVRVGVGIGLGICGGVGICVGLLVRTYQSTTQNLRRQLL